MLHICGAGIYCDYYKKMAVDLNIEKNCIFYGHCNRKKVYSVVEQMDFNISASIFECSGVSVQEAMLLGKPLVVTKSGGANSLVSESTAIVVEKESIDALVVGLKKMIKEYVKFDEKEIMRYAEKYEINIVTKQYVELYQNIMNQK